MMTIAMYSIARKNPNASTETKARWYAKSAPASEVRALDQTNARTL